MHKITTYVSDRLNFSKGINDIIKINLRTQSIPPIFMTAKFVTNMRVYTII